MAGQETKRKKEIAEEKNKGGKTRNEEIGKERRKERARPVNPRARREMQAEMKRKRQNCP